MCVCCILFHNHETNKRYCCFCLKRQHNITSLTAGTQQSVYTHHDRISLLIVWMVLARNLKHGRDSFLVFRDQITNTVGNLYMCVRNV